MRPDNAAGELWTAGLLNAAAVGLKLEEWSGAAATCQLALKDAPQNPKALYRLAQAQNGDRELKAAQVTEQSLDSYYW